MSSDPSKTMIPLTVRFPLPIYNIVADLADESERSINKQVIYLLKGALEAELAEAEVEEETTREESILSGLGNDQR